VNAVKAQQPFVLQCTPKVPLAVLPNQVHPTRDALFFAKMFEKGKWGICLAGLMLSHTPCNQQRQNKGNPKVPETHGVVSENPWAFLATRPSNRGSLQMEKKKRVWIVFIVLKFSGSIFANVKLLM